MTTPVARTQRVHRVGIVCTWAVPTAAVGVGIALAAAAGTADVIDGYLAADAVMGVSTSAIAAILVAHVPRNRLGYLFALSGWSYGLSTLASGYLATVIAWGWAGGTAVAWIEAWSFVPALSPSLTLLLAWFPDGKPLSTRWRPLGWVTVAALFVTTVALMVSPRLQLTADVELNNPIGLAWSGAMIGPLLLVVVATALASATSLLLRMHHSEASERRRIAPYVVAAGVAVLATAIGRSVPAWEPLLQTVTLPLLPIAAAVCVLRYRLFDVEVVVRRSLVWLGMTALVIGSYVVVVQAVANLLHRQAGVGESLIATAVVAVGFQPAQAALRRMVNRWLFGDRDDPEAAIGRLGQRLALEVEPARALHAATNDVASALAVPWVAVEIDHGTMNRITTESGVRPSWVQDADLERVALIHAGHRQGHLVVSRRSPYEDLSSSDRLLLEQLTRPLAAAAAAAGLTEELRRSREQIVLGREEERRRLRHDLHDGVGPLLASAAAHADAAALRMDRDPAAVPAMLRVVRETVQEAVVGLRRAVEGLRPPTLDEFGLVGAVSERGQAVIGPDGPTLDVCAGPLPALPAAVEVAAYRIALEAVTNAVRHASADHITVRLVGPEAGHGLIVEVTDDGAGLPSDVATGVGLASMRARASELGGTLAVCTLPTGGTRACAEIPMAEASP